MSRHLSSTCARKRAVDKGPAETAKAGKEGVVGGWHKQFTGISEAARLFDDMSENGEMEHRMMLNKGGDEMPPVITQEPGCARKQRVVAHGSCPPGALVSLPPGRLVLGEAPPVSTPPSEVPVTITPPGEAPAVCAPPASTPLGPAVNELFGVSVPARMLEPY